MDSYLKEAHNLFPFTQGLRRDFHAHPELGFREVRTAGIVANQLVDLNMEVHTGIAETGVMALLEGSGPGPVVLLRFDMDALPIQETTGAEYASQIPGVMHACGHDGHTAIGLSVAKLLHTHRQEFPGTVKFVFQPAEEGLGGAQKMVSGGILANPKPDITLALHLWNDKPLGWFGITRGPIMAAAEIFRVVIKGRGGHGASPHLTIDPVATTAQVINSLQTIVSRNVSPLDTAVVTVSSLNAGTAFNVIPDYVEIKGTIRTYKPEVRRVVLKRFKDIVEGTCKALGCEAEIELEKLTPAVQNDSEIAKKVAEIASEIFPEGQIDNTFHTMGSEDMAYMMESIPGCYFFVGSANRESGLDGPHHSSRFDFDEQALPAAVGLMVSCAMRFLNS